MQSQTPTILVIDDDQALREFIAENLKLHDYAVLTAADGQAGLTLFGAQSPDLVISDIVMPVMDGFELCRRIREQSQVPIIMLSALDEDHDIVRALDLGADDYLTKPFSVIELLARIRATTRRVTWQPSGDEHAVLHYGALEVDAKRAAVLLHGERVELTRTEYAILHYLVAHADETVSHHTLLEEIWGFDHQHQPEYLRVYIGRIRRKIEVDPSHPTYIISEYGKGYRVGRAKHEL